MLIEAIATRLQAQVTVLDKRVGTALELTEMVRRKALPAATPWGFIVPGGLQPRGAAEISEAYYIQQVDELVSVVLVLQSASDVRGSKLQPQLHPLVWKVILGLAGWGPDDEPIDDGEPEPIGVLELRRARLVSLDAGIAFYQIDFAIHQQVRIT